MTKPDKLYNQKKRANGNIKIVYYDKPFTPKVRQADIIASQNFYQMLKFFTA
ncbi:MAG: hypothetical protein N3E37_01360 [Candidatus Micrarchaeota archaeon]|nr:hypothetical protein [Candidatus Micrarchaeota archaeon]